MPAPINKTRKVSATTEAKRVKAELSTCFGELESAKAQLASVRAERDSILEQLATKNDILAALDRALDAAGAPHASRAEGVRMLAGRVEHHRGVATSFAAELGQIDAVLARRPALELEPTRVGKLERTLSVARNADALANELLECQRLGAAALAERMAECVRFSAAARQAEAERDAAVTKMSDLQRALHIQGGR